MLLRRGIALLLALFKKPKWPRHNVLMSTIKNISAFGRDLPFLDQVLLSPPAWWRELLSLWRPAGMPSDDLGLRLAVRNGYLNLYRKGQSVAQVKQARTGQLQWTLHRKYLGDEGQDDLDAGSLYRPAPVNVELPKWVRAAEEKAGREKKAIDEILDRDANVIDLEMGLPAGVDQKSASRIDMVSLECVDDATTRLMFWEVKTFDDARIRTSGELPVDVGILAQMGAYRKFLADSERASQVISAYQHCANLLCSLARSIGGEERLGSEIRALAAGKKLVLADQPGLLVVLPNRELPDRSKAAWDVHRDKLDKSGIKLRMELVKALD